jgi:flagellar export protein FliJ
MKGFSFRLDRILRLREDAERQQARVYGQAAKAESEATRQCEEQADYLERIGERLAPPPGEQTNAGLLRVLSLTLAAAARQLDQARQHRDQARETATTELDRLSQARVGRQSLERIRGHRHAAWKEATGREEQKDTDEIAARSRGRPKP